jgi:Mn-dependent DtxR family transcriptional regulator
MRFKGGGTMIIRESAENYLETIYVLQQTKGSVRSIDVVNALGFSKPSVSVAMKNLRENGYIKVNRNGSIELLEPGFKIAKSMNDRHTFFKDLLQRLGVDEEIADKDACKMEHAISESSFTALQRLLDIV